MTVLFKRPDANPATQDRVAEVGQAFQRTAEGLRPPHLRLSVA